MERTTTYEEHLLISRKAEPSASRRNTDSAAKVHTRGTLRRTTFPKSSFHSLLLSLQVSVGCTAGPCGIQLCLSMRMGEADSPSQSCAALHCICEAKWERLKEGWRCHPRYEWYHLKPQCLACLRGSLIHPSKFCPDAETQFWPIRQDQLHKASVGNRWFTTSRATTQTVKPLSGGTDWLRSKLIQWSHLNLVFQAEEEAEIGWNHIVQNHIQTLS